MGSPECEFLLDCGVIVRADTAKIVDKEAIVSAVCHHYLIADIYCRIGTAMKGVKYS